MGITIALSRGHHVGGKVTWPDGSPATGAAVHARAKVPTEDASHDPRRFHSPDEFLPKIGMTGDRGEFTISGLGAGPITLTAIAHRAAGEGAPGENLPAWTAQIAGVPSDSEDVALVLREPIDLAGRVIDDQGAPVKSFAITTSPDREDDEESISLGEISLKTTTFEAPDGSFLLTGLQPGKWKIAAEAKGYVQVEEPTVEVPRTEGPLVVELSRAASASGLVVDPDGRPVAQADVSQHTGTDMDMFGTLREKASAKTDEKGGFTIGDLPPGSSRLVASAEGFARSEPTPLVVVAGQKIEGVVIHLRRGGRLTGEVFDAHGSHAVGRGVMVMSMGAQEGREATVDAEGLFAIENLAPGAYQVIAQPTQAEQESMMSKGGAGGEIDPSEIFSALKMTSAQIREGETTHVILGAPPKAPVRVFGTVTRGGQPVRSGTILCVGEGGALLSKLKMATVHENGDYEIKLDEPGAVVLAYQREIGGVGASELHVTIPAEAEFRVDLDVPTGGLRGFVRGPDAAPVAGIAVNLLRQGGLSSISAMDQGGDTTSDESGRFEFQDLSPGTYGLAAGGTDALSGESKDARWGRAVLTGLRVETGRYLEGIEIRLSKPGTITGLVRDTDGKPVSNATVFARDEHGEILNRFSGVVTDAGGRFAYHGVGPGRYSLCARTKTLASPESALVSVHEGASAEVELTAEAPS
jgi:protocatechuate 3,4-dioxygenase beta subunit